MQARLQQCNTRAPVVIPFRRFLRELSQARFTREYLTREYVTREYVTREYFTREYFTREYFTRDYH